MTAIEFNHVGKQYRLGLVGTGTLSHDLNRWWQTSVLHHEDPYLKIGDINDRAVKATSDYIWALRDIDFKVEQGDVVGIIGKNGAGKSTLLKLLSRVTAPTVGTINARGRIASLLEVGTGFHGEMTGRENIYMNGAILGMSKHEIAAKLDEIIAFSGCEKYIDTPVKRYSSGMTVRLGFAVAAFLEPEILVVDEVLAVGDAEFQKKAIGKMQDVASGGRTVLFVSHNMASVKSLCKSGVLLKNGMIDYIGTAEDTVLRYLSANIDVEGISLVDRKDKVGNKRIEVTNITFRNINGDAIEEAFVGQYLRVDFDFKINDPNANLKDMIVACSFTDHYLNPAVLWVSDEIEHDFTTIRNNHFSLIIPSLNLRPNVYAFNYQVSLGSTGEKDFCDALTHAVSFNILEDKTAHSSKVITRNGYSALITASFE